MLHEYRVGTLYHPGRTSWEERGVYQHRSGAHELVLFFERPTPAEVRAVREGEAAFAVLAELPVLIFCYRFGTALPWSDAPFSIHLLPKGTQTAPFLFSSAEERALLNIVLVGAEDGIIRALRAVTFSPAFSRFLHQSIREQWDWRWDEGVFDRKLTELYRRYPTAHALADAATACCRGGD